MKKLSKRIILLALTGVLLLCAQRAQAASSGWQSFTAYAYCPCQRCCGKGATGTTASGTKAQEGRTIAADWSVLPKGTRVEIEGVGIRTVEDRGVSGKSVDVFMNSHQTALNFGRRSVRLRIIEENELAPRPKRLSRRVQRRAVTRFQRVSARKNVSAVLRRNVLPR